MISIEKLRESRDILRRRQRELHIDLSDGIRELTQEIIEREVVEEAMRKDKGFADTYRCKGEVRKRWSAVGTAYKVGDKVNAARYTGEGKVWWRMVSDEKLEQYPDWFVVSEGHWKAVIIRRYYTVNKGWKNYQTRLVVVEGPYQGKIVSVRS